MASGCLQTVSVKSSEQQQQQQQQQLEKDLWGSFRCAERILKGKETFLWVILSRYFQWHIQTLCREASHHLHDALSNCCCLLLVSVNVPEHSDASLNSVQASQSTSKPSLSPPSAQDLESDFMSVVNWSFNHVSIGETKKMAFFVLNLFYITSGQFSVFNMNNVL